MSTPAVQFRSISTSMLQRIVTLAVICFVLIGSLQVWLERQQQQKTFARTMALMVETSNQAIAHALWDIDREVVVSHMQKLSDLEMVGFVKVHVQTTDEVLKVGNDALQSERASYQSLIYSPDVRKQLLGTLEVWADPDHYRHMLWASQLRVVPGYLVFTILMCLMVAWVMRRDLGMPLRQIADFVRNLKPEELNQPLQIRRPPRERSDEIDMVTQGFHHLQHALDRHIKDLDGLVKERTAELSLLVDEVKRLSQIDVLTGVYNRRAMELRLPLDLERCARYGRPFSVIFTDIDHFKRINDQFGHAVGDAVLKDVAKRLQESLRANLDWVVRFGGEEFVIFMPETEGVHAVEAAQRLAQSLRSSPWEGQGATLFLTCSFGVAQYRDGDSMDRLLERADALLYQAKANGRDRVEADIGMGAAPIQDRTD